MAKLDANRMLNSTRLKQVDDAHRDLELALESLLGVPDNTEITGSVFGINPEAPSEPPVQSDGSIRGVPVFASDGAVISAGSAPGWQFTDGTVLLKIALVSGALGLYKSEDSGSSWSLVSNLEDPASGQGLFTGLSDVNIDALVADKIVRTQSDGAGGYEFVLDDPASVDGKTTFVSLDDTPPDALADHIGEIVYVAGAGSLDYQAAPAGLGNPFIVFVKADSTQDWPRDWSQAYNWVHDDLGSGDTTLGGQATTTGVLENQTSSPVRTNPYFYLEAGTYEVELWYYTTDAGDIYGTRQWKLAPASGTAATHSAGVGIGQAFDSVEANPPLVWRSDNNKPSAVSGLKRLGSAKAVVTTAGCFEIDVKHSNTYATGSAAKVFGVTFYASICKVK